MQTYMKRETRKSDKMKEKRTNQWGREKKEKKRIWREDESSYKINLY